MRKAYWALVMALAFCYVFGRGASGMAGDFVGDVKSLMIRRIRGLQLAAHQTVFHRLRRQDKRLTRNRS